MKYTESHEWIKLESEKIGTVGISAHANKELGEIVYIELPKIGSEIKAGDELCVVESSKAAADIYSPVSGKVVAVNPELSDNPSILNESPEEKGWICRIEIDALDELEPLLDKQDYEASVS